MIRWMMTALPSLANAATGRTRFSFVLLLLFMLPVLKFRFHALFAEYSVEDQ